MLRGGTGDIVTWTLWVLPFRKNDGGLPELAVLKARFCERAPPWFLSLDLDLGSDPLACSTTTPSALRRHSGGSTSHQGQCHAVGIFNFQIVLR